jgi:hypothetical protein
VSRAATYLMMAATVALIVLDMALLLGVRP